MNTSSENRAPNLELISIIKNRFFLLLLIILKILNHSLTFCLIKK